MEKFCNRAGVDLFFFGDHPNFRLCFRICTLASTIKPATASHRPAFVGELIEMSIKLVKSVVFHRSKKRDLRSKKRDKASKSGTVPPKAGRMVTLLMMPTTATSTSTKRCYSVILFTITNNETVLPYASNATKRVIIYKACSDTIVMLSYKTIPQVVCF